MRNIKFVSLLFSFLLVLCCTRQEKEMEESFEIIGLWVEKDPELFDGVSDTIVFTEDFKIKKHFFFKGYNYEHVTDTLIFYNDVHRRERYYEMLNSKEIKIYNFTDRLTTDQQKDISFIKNN